MISRKLQSNGKGAKKILEDFAPLRLCVRFVFALGTKVKILIHLESGIVSPVSETQKASFINLYFLIIRNTSLVGLAQTLNAAQLSSTTFWLGIYRHA
ncbi:MAG TPA: hypothetical protein VJT69_11800 [Pyrinomonadaceae bacterium]|nr:hypothetical protein [Pyrinomonadaceae bacterium]